MRTKTPEQIAIQKAIVCLYLRKRRARQYWREAGLVTKNYTNNIYRDVANQRFLEFLCIGNDLISVRRVLRGDDWS